MPYTHRKNKLRRLKRKFRRNRGLTRTQAKSVKSIAKQAVSSMSEKKTFIWQNENQQLLHNVPTYVGNFLSCTQGTSDPDDGVAQRARIGDEILLKNVNIRLWLSNKLDRPNVMYKCFLFWYDSDATLNNALCFFTQTNKMLDRTNDEQISIIDQKTIFSGANYSAAPNEREHSYLCTLNGSWKHKKIKYDEGGTSPKKRTIGLAVVCYDAFGTLQTDNIASFAFNSATRFIDP